MFELWMNLDRMSSLEPSGFFHSQSHGEKKALNTSEHGSSPSLFFTRSQFSPNELLLFPPSLDLMWPVFPESRTEHLHSGEKQSHLAPIFKEEGILGEL